MKKFDMAKIIHQKKSETRIEYENLDDGKEYYLSSKIRRDLMAQFFGGEPTDKQIDNWIEMLYSTNIFRQIVVRK